MTVIIGIDPGSRATGYGVIRQQEGGLYYLGSGTIRTATAGDFARRLPLIYAGMCQIIAQFSPTIVAVEQVFVAQNAASALKLGQARGVAIAAAISADLPLAEYAARQIKRAVTGSGAADKCQVQHMVRLLLRLSATPSADAADALAVAITCSHHHGSSSGGYVRRDPGYRQLRLSNEVSHATPRSIGLVAD